MTTTARDHTNDVAQVHRLSDHLHTVGVTSGIFFCAILIGAGIAWWSTRRRQARWTWGLLWSVPLLELVGAVCGGRLPADAAAFSIAAVVGLMLGHLAVALRLEIDDRHAGDDRGHDSRERIGPFHFYKRWYEQREGIMAGDSPELQIGLTRRGEMGAIKRGGTSGSHRFVIGASGSGKTTLLAVLAAEGVARANAVVMVEGKIDPDLEDQARVAAHTVGREFVLVSPSGEWTWDMLAAGDIDETVAKLLACEEWTEPYYHAEAMRFLRWVVRVGRELDGKLSLGRVLELCEPDRLASTAATTGDARLAAEVEKFIDGLSARERTDVGGLRSRLAVLAESDFGRDWLDPESAAGPVLDLREAIERRAVIYFRVDAERLGPVAEKVGAAVAIELGAIASSLQGRPIPTTICIDEFSAIETEQVDRLFSRGRAAGFSVTVATHTLADLRAAGEAVEDRIKATVESVLCFRVGADDADSIARIAGQVGTWQRTSRTDGALGFVGAEGTRTRGYRLRVHPSILQHLDSGECAVIRLDQSDDRRVQIVKVISMWNRRQVRVWPVDEDDG